MAKRTLPSTIAELFEDFPGFRSRAMFGAFGLYLHDSFFAVVGDDRLFFRVTDETRPDYEAAGMGPFRPWEDAVIGGYYEVPPAVLADQVLFREWAIRAADRTTASPRKPNRSSRPRRKMS